MNAAQEKILGASSLNDFIIALLDVINKYEKKTCRFCYGLVDISSNFCEYCGTAFEHDITDIIKNSPLHTKMEKEL